MLGNEVEGSVLGVRLAHQDAAIAQTCVPLVALKGKSYRLRERGSGVVPAAQAPSLRSSA